MMNRRQALGLCTVGAASATLANPLRADWTSWRGESRDGVVAAEWPTSLGGLTKTWSKPFSDSYSGPIVADGLVYTTETVGKKDEALIALDTQSGEVAWRKEWPGAMSVPFFAAKNGSWIRSTPACDGKHVVVGGIRDVVACFDAKTGEEKWRVDFIKEHGSTLPSFGLVCSPLIDGDHVYMQCGGGVKKLSMSDGSIVWSTLPEDGGMSGGAFSSPMISTLHGVRQLVVQTRTELAGVNLETGGVIWSKPIASFRGMNILTPTVWNDKVFTSCYGGRAQLYELTPNGEKWDTQLVWESKAEAYMSSPIVVGDHLYMHLRNKRVSCSDLSSGTETWRTTPFGEYWSMVTNGDEILALDEKGELLLLEANPKEFKIIDRKQVSSEPSWAYLAISGDQLFIRRQRGLDAYKWS